MEWKTIDSAPKDGTDIILGFKDQCRPPVIMGWFDRWEDYDCLNTVKGKPTHWMRLPESPK